MKDKYYQKNKKRILQKCKVYYQKNKLSYAQRWRVNALKHKQSWLIYFLGKSPQPQCEICNKKLEYFSGNIVNSVNFDHKEKGLAIQGSPANFLQVKYATPENIKIWESCKFGTLCQRCNALLPTASRKEWIRKVNHYIEKH